MLYLVIGLIALGLITALLTLLMRPKGNNDEQPIVTGSDCSSCNGTDDRCEQVCMMEAATKDIEYYDDEELDQYQGRPSDQYTDEETEDEEDLYATVAANTGWNAVKICPRCNKKMDRSSKFCTGCGMRL